MESFVAGTVAGMAGTNFSDLKTSMQGCKAMRDVTEELTLVTQGLFDMQDLADKGPTEVVNNLIAAESAVQTLMTAI
jgi:hypothetical protein